MSRVALRYLVLSSLVAATLLPPTLASAQSLGTFRWQLSPYCNVLTLVVTQIGTQYRFEGTDDQCGATTRAPVLGLGVPNADGTLEFGLTIVTATGPAHVDVTFNVAALGGTWRDGQGGTGTFTFNPPVPASGSPRPPAVITIPDGAITTAKLAAGAVDTSRLAAGAVDTSRLAAGAVDSSRVLDGSLGAADINTAEVQRRVGGVCPAGQYLQTINADGTVACGTDATAAGTITSVTAGNGLLGGGTTGAVTLSVNLAGTGTAATVARSDHTHAAAGTDNTGVGVGAATAITTGSNNTAIGARTADSITTGTQNTAVGTDALTAVTTSSSNTGVGYKALTDTSFGSQNTALGAFALSSNTFGGSNVAVGFEALRTNAASNNVAVGYQALASNTTGISNTALGHRALTTNASAGSNTAVGSAALFASTGDSNTAVGAGALYTAVNAAYNTAVGTSALESATGSSNTAVGRNALRSATFGQSNIALGQAAGINVLGGSNNILIGNDGTSADTGLIRIGTGQNKTFIAGIRGITTGVADAVAVVVDSAGQLGTVSSSRRYKDDISDLRPMADRLLRLRPVQFRYRQPFNDGDRPMQYGLIAEEVAEVFPELVVFNEQHEPETVKYHILPSLLLAEVQRLEERVHALEAELKGKR